MKLDALTLFFSMMTNVMLMSIALSVGVRWQSRSGIRAWAVALALQAVGWAALLSAYRVWPRELATVGVTLLVAAFSFVHLAAKSYLHERPSRAWLWGPVVVTAVIHWFIFDHFAGRVALANFALGVQMTWTAWALLRPRRQAIDWRWRWLAGTALIASATMVWGRMGLVLLAPEQYPRFETAHWINTLGLIISNANLVVGSLAFLLAHRNEAEEELHRLASTDGLTGVMTRRHWMDASAQHLRLAERHGPPLTAVMLDVDHFKRINDTQGHAAGDRALALFAKVLQQSVRGPDLVGRYGGEEFCLLLPQSDEGAALAIDRRLRDLLAAASGPQLGLALTFSAGVARWRPGMSLAELLSAADEALFRAKNAGRNRLEVAVTPAADRTPSTTG